MDISGYIEYTNLKMNLPSKEVKRFIDTAAERGYRSVVLTYNNIGLAKSYINRKGYDLKVVTVLGFPSDNYKFSILDDYKNDFDELDIVLPIQDYYYSYPPYYEKIEKILKFVKEKMTGTLLNARGKKISKPLKLIIETAMMRAKPMQIKELCEMAKKCGVNCIKTNTGLIKRKGFEDLVEDINLIKKNWKGEIKASGGIYKKDDAEILVKAGATLIGTSKDICAPEPPATAIVPSAFAAEEKKEGDKK